MTTNMMIQTYFTMVFHHDKEGTRPSVAQVKFSANQSFGGPLLLKILKSCSSSFLNIIFLWGSSSFKVCNN